MHGLSLEGGGVLGAAQAGMLYQALRSDYNDYKFPADIWPIVAGTSIGALNGLFIALRFSAQEIFDLWRNIERKDLLRKKLSLFISSYSREPMINFVKNIIKEKTGKDNISFSELYKLTGVDLICTGSVVQTGKALIFGKDYIDYDVFTAIMMSTSHPGSFDPVEYIDPKDGKTYQIIDGGTLMNSPILPLFKKGCEDITVLSIGSIDPDFKFKGPIVSLSRILEFITLGNELVSLSWASFVYKNLLLYHADCKNVEVLEFSKIKTLLEEGILAWNKGPCDPNELLYQFDINSNNINQYQVKIR